MLLILVLYVVGHELLRCRLCFFFQAEDGIRDLVRSRGLGDVYKRQLYARLDPLSETALAAEPAPGKWSVAQVITHLAIAEEGALAYLLKKRDLGAHGPVPFSARWRMAALRAALYLPFKYNAPAVVATVPSLSLIHI